MSLEHVFCCRAAQGRGEDMFAEPALHAGCARQDFSYPQGLIVGEHTQNQEIGCLAAFSSRLSRRYFLLSFTDRGQTAGIRARRAFSTGAALPRMMPVA